MQVQSVEYYGYGLLIVYCSIVRLFVCLLNYGRIEQGKGKRKCNNVNVQFVFEQGIATACKLT